MDVNDVYEIDCNNRNIFKHLIQIFYFQEFILIIYKIWQRMNTIWLDKNLHNSILKM